MLDRGIAPGLLVASPDLQDANFTRTVVLMIQHDEESSFGLVVNRPTRQRLSEASEDLPVGSGAHRGSAIFCGGPVPAQEGEPHGFVLHYHSAGSAQSADDIDDLDDTDEGISLYTVPLDSSSMRALETEPSEHLRFLVGSARWAPGQLETELLHGAWLVAEADPQIIFETPVDAIWDAAIRSLGIDPATLLPGTLIANPVIH